MQSKASHAALALAINRMAAKFYLTDKNSVDMMRSEVVFMSDNATKLKKICGKYPVM